MGGSFQGGSWADVVDSHHVTGEKVQGGGAALRAICVVWLHQRPQAHRIDPTAQLAHGPL